MATYRKPPVEFNVPRNADKHGHSFVPFTGLEINENPVLNSASSASDMLNMVVDDDYFLTLRPRLIEDEEYNRALKLVTANPAVVSRIVDTLVLRQGLYLFSVKPTFAIDPNENLTVVVEGDYVKTYSGNKSFQNDFIDYIISRDGDAFRFVSKIDDDPKMIVLSRSENGWDIATDEPYTPTYRAVITQSSNLLEQPIFEDLNILTTKYKLSVIYDENNPVELDGFYTSAEVIEGAPYFVDVSVAGIDEDEGVRVYASSLIISKLRVGASGDLFDFNPQWIIEIYNGTGVDASMGSGGVNPSSIGLQKEPNANEYINLRSLYLEYFPGTSPVIPAGKTWLIHNSPTLNLIYSDNEVNGVPFLYVSSDEFDDDFTTGSVVLLRRWGGYRYTIIDSLPTLNDPLPFLRLQMERAPNVLRGKSTWSSEETINPYTTSDWVYTLKVFTNVTGLGIHGMNKFVYGDGSFLGSGRKALCYESSSYSLYYDYRFVLSEMFKDSGGIFSDFSFDILKIDHTTKLNTVFTTINVMEDGGGETNFIDIVDFRRLWNEDIVYDANSNPVYTLHYDAKSGKFIRANFNKDGGDNSIGTRRGGNMVNPVGLRLPIAREENWRMRFNDIIYYVPETNGAKYYNNMDLDMPSNMLDELTYTYSNTNYLRNYYFEGVLVTVHSGTWGQGVGDGTPEGIGIRNLGIAMVVTNLTTLTTTRIIGKNEVVNVPIVHNITASEQASSESDATFHIEPQRCVQDLLVLNNDFIKGVIHNDTMFAILTSVELNKVFIETPVIGSDYFYRKDKTFFYHIDNYVLDPESGADMGKYFGIYGGLLGESREIAIRQIGAQILLCNYTEEGLISSTTPLFYIMSVILNASKVLDVAGTKLATEHDLLNINIDSSGNIRLIAQTKNIEEKKVKLAFVNFEKSVTSNRLVYNNLDIAESMYITETSELATGGFMVFSEHGGYYYYGLLSVSKDEIVFTYDLDNNIRNILRLDEDVLTDYYTKRKEWVEQSYETVGNGTKQLISVSDMLDSSVYYKRNYLFLTYPSKPNYIPLVNVMKTKRTVRSATSYLQQLGVVYEENNVEYLQIAENPFVETNYLMHTYIPRLTSVEQPAIDYFEEKHLLTFIGLTVYLNEGGLFGLNFNADTPQDDQRKATLLSKAVNKKLLKYDLTTAFLSNYDPYILITIPQDGETHVFAYKIAVNQWFFWKLPVVITKIDGDNFKSRFHYGANRVAMFTDEPIVLEKDEDGYYTDEYHMGVERYLDFDDTPISWFWKSQILSLGSITKRKQITDTYFVFVNNNANIVLDENENYDIVERQVTTQGFGLRYLTFKDTVDIAPRVEYEQELNIINNLRKRTYLNRFNYCQLLCYNIDKDNPIQDKVRIANIIITYKTLTGGK